MAVKRYPDDFPAAGWLALAEPDDPVVHVLPLGDLIVHEHIGDDCVCGPSATPNGGGWTLTHHALDGRQHTEPDHDRATCPGC